MKTCHSGELVCRAIKTLLPAAAILIWGCGGGYNTQQVVVAVSPQTVVVKTGQTQQFTSSVSGTTNTAVTWQVSSMGAGPASIGTISASGLYTPPPAPPPGSVTVSATSQADTTKVGTATLTVADGTAPSTPAGLTATATSATQISLAWTASTDNVGVTGYQVQRCSGNGCSPTTQVGTPTTNSFNDTGLTPSTSYSYRVSATDAAGNVSGFSTNASANTPASGLVVSITPVRGGLTVTQKLSLTPTVTGDALNQGVSWSFSSTGPTAGGSFSPSTTASGTPVTFTAPTGAGVVTVTATSVTDVTKTALATIGVTDLKGVFTYHNDVSRDGVNTQEYALTTANVKPATFGKLFSCAVDGAVYAQPLWVANVTVSGVKHNLLIAASTHDTVYAFDTDGTSCSMVWFKSLLASGENWVSSNDVSCSDLVPDVGIVGTPVIDSTTNTVYVVSKSKNGSNTIFQRIHALDLSNGSEKFNGPTVISGSIGSASFDPVRNNQRAGLALGGGKVYIAWASHCDVSSYRGWVFGYSASDLTIAPSVFTSAPHATTGVESGIWMAGGAPAVDSSNNLFLITGNGTFDANSLTAPNDDYGDSILRLSTSSGISVSDFFTPSDFASLQSSDTDLGSGGATVLLDPSSGPNPHLMIGGGKEGILYLLNRDGMGHTGDGGAIQRLSTGGAIFSTPALWNNRLYVGAAFARLQLFTFNTSGPQIGMFNSPSASQSSDSYNFPGTTPSVSARPDNTNGIVWALSNSAYCTDQSSSCGPAILRAYDAMNVGTELWHSDANAADAAGFAVKFTVPTVANGKVYVGTRGNNTGGTAGSTPGEIDVYGLKPN